MKRKRKDLKGLVVAHVSCQLCSHQFFNSLSRKGKREGVEGVLNAAKGLGEVYEEEYVRAKSGNVLDDKDEKTRSEARLLLKELFAKLDALSHFHFAPKPIIQDPTIRKEVPALAMEEVAPQVVH